jgi:hypothetical protein
MAKYQAKSAKTGKVYEFEAASPPSEADVDEFVEAQDASVSKEIKTPEFEEFEKDYIAKEQRGRLAQMADVGMMGPKIAGSLLNTAKEGVEGVAEIYGDASTKEGLLNKKAAIDRNLAQSALEGAGRMGFDILDAARRAPRAAVEAVIRNPDVLMRLGVPMDAALDLILSETESRTPAQQEIERAFAREQENKAFQDVRSENIVPEIIGKTNPKVAEAVAQLGDPEMPAGLIAGTLLKGATKTGLKEAVRAKPPVLREKGIGAPPIPEEGRPPILSEGLPITTPEQAAARGAGSIKAGEFTPVEKPDNFVQLTGRGIKETLEDVFEVSQPRLASSAVKPSLGSGLTGESLVKTWVPSVYESAKKRKISLSGSEDLKPFIDATEGSLKDVSSEISQALKKSGERGDNIDLNDLKGEANERILNRTTFRKESEKVPARSAQKQKINELLDSYNDIHTVQEAEDILQEQNALLDSHYVKTKTKGEGMTVEELAKTDPEMATRLLIAERLRDKLDDVVSNLPGEFAGLKQKWAVNKNTLTQLRRQNIIIERQQLVPLHQKMSMGETYLSGGIKGVSRAAIAKALKIGDSAPQKLQKLFYQHELSLRAGTFEPPPLKPRISRERQKVERYLEEQERQNLNP